MSCMELMSCKLSSLMKTEVAFQSPPRGGTTSPAVPLGSRHAVVAKVNASLGIPQRLTLLFAAMNSYSFGFVQTHTSIKMLSVPL